MQVVRELAPPPRPVVGHVVSPHVQLVRDVLLGQQPGQRAGAGLGAGGVLPHALPADQPQVHLPAQPVQVLAVQPGDVLDRGVEVERLAALAPAVPASRV